MTTSKMSIFYTGNSINLFVDASSRPSLLVSASHKRLIALAFRKIATFTRISRADATNQLRLNTTRQHLQSCQCRHYHRVTSDSSALQHAHTNTMSPSNTIITLTLTRLPYSMRRRRAPFLATTSLPTASTTDRYRLTRAPYRNTPFHAHNL